MKAYFDVYGALTVEGEDATEWLALRTWAQNWTDNKIPLWVAVKKATIEGFHEGDCLQLFRAHNKAVVCSCLERTTRQLFAVV